MQKSKEGVEQRMKTSISQDDFGTLCICAIRYCQGRQTYMPSLVQDICREHLSEFADRDIRVMINDCEDQERTPFLYGDQIIDKPDWLKWREDLIKERNRRAKKERNTQ